MLRAGQSRLRACLISRLLAPELHSSGFSTSLTNERLNAIDSCFGVLEHCRQIVSLADFDPITRAAPCPWRPSPSAPHRGLAAASTICQSFNGHLQLRDDSKACRQHRSPSPSPPLTFRGSYRSYQNVVGESVPDDERHESRVLQKIDNNVQARREIEQNQLRQRQQQHSQPQRPTQQQAAATLGSHRVSSGWTRREVVNAPNAISLARLLSGPLIAHWIIEGNTQAAFIGLAVSGWSDWLDGYVARHFNQQSTIGSYLDPLADKALICCVVVALGIQGTLPGYLTAVIIGRDVFLVAASFAHRARSLGWRRVSIAEFFQVAGPDAQGQPQAENAAAKVQPLYISKVNTVVQLATISCFLLHAWAGWPSADLLHAAAVLTAGSTIVSGGAYIVKFGSAK